MREMSTIVMSQPDLLWDETQTHIDLIAFHGTDPDHTLNLETPETEIQIQKVRYSRVMEKTALPQNAQIVFTAHTVNISCTKTSAVTSIFS